MMLYGSSGLLLALEDISWNAVARYNRDEMERGFLRAELEMMTCVCTRAHTHIYIYVYILNIKKAISVQAWTGPEGPGRYRLPDFKTIGSKCGKVVSPTDRPPLPPGNIPGTHFC